jgi:thioredoxin 1
MGVPPMSLVKVCPMAEALTTIVTCPNCGAKNRVNVRAAETKQPVCGRCKTALIVPAMAGAAAGADGKPVELSDATFDDFLRNAGEKPVLVDAWAAWCGPCRMLAPTIDALASEANGKYLVAKLDTDRNPTVASRYRISALPTVLIFKRGQVVDQLVGLQPKQAIAAQLTKHAA